MDVRMKGRDQIKKIKCRTQNTDLPKNRVKERIQMIIQRVSS